MVTFDLFSFTVSISRRKKALSNRYEDNLRISRIIEDNKRKQNDHMHFWY
ncbi:putative sporulation protein YrzI [Scopulibacillus darangshiensis]|uniref:Putative sporulation protein YrzI n=1 Tax=Scopulibacillus darangshiensis TaxID=442528 RepID=A0A4R2P469_9BACL|nr:YrzI family small protein [Scopulibacillus darangshiensis]TCP28844.1 putative sporulation protein YrzI [Scopulibacillus darangshiensis]